MLVLTMAISCKKPATPTPPQPTPLPNVIPPSPPPPNDDERPPVIISDGSLDVYLEVNKDNDPGKQKKRGNWSDKGGFSWEHAPDGSPKPLNALDAYLIGGVGAC